MTFEETIGRQWQILQAFAERREEGWTRRELAERFGVCRKTIERDLKTLQSVFGDFDVECATRGVKRYALSKSSPFSFDLNLNRSEILALYIGKKLMGPLRGTYFWDEVESGGRKLAAALPTKKVDYAERVAPLFYQFEPTAPSYDERTGRVIDAALVAMEDSRVLRISYRSLQSKVVKTYEILPYAFLHWRGSVYLVGHSRKDGETRFWKANRATAAEPLEERFKPPKDFDVDRMMRNAVVPFVGAGEAVCAKIRFTGAAARLVYELRSQSIRRIVEETDDSVVVEITLENGLPSIRWILGFGSSAVVLEPPELRDAIAEELEKILAKYPRRPASDGGALESR